jgi:hypothetical protein
MSGLGQGYTGYFFALYACPVEGGDERQKSVIPLRGRELREGRNTKRSIISCESCPKTKKVIHGPFQGPSS